MIEAQVCTLILIGWKMEYLFDRGSGLYPYPDDRKMEYLFDRGSGLYPYPDRVENEIPQRLLYPYPDRAEND